MQVKHYTKIVRQDKPEANFHLVGDRIVVQEKLDGANASFKISNQKEILCFSRRTKLDKENNLRGFYQYIEKLQPTLEKLFLKIKELRFYGEWLVPHKVQYKENFNEFYLFDVYNETSGEYLKYDEVVYYSKLLNLKMVPVFFDGEFKDMDQLKQFVGRTKMADGFGEGIVIKNQNRYGGHGEKTIRFTKMVSNEFTEVHRKKTSPDKQKQMSESQKWISTYLTESRVEKMIFKYEDNGFELSFKNFGNIMSKLTHSLLNDILEEEGKEKPKDFNDKDALRPIGNIAASLLRNIIYSKEAV